MRRYRRSSTRGRWSVSSSSRVVVVGPADDGERHVLFSLHVRHSTSPALVPRLDRCHSFARRLQPRPFRPPGLLRRCRRPFEVLRRLARRRHPRRRRGADFAPGTPGGEVPAEVLVDGAHRVPAARVAREGGAIGEALHILGVAPLHLVLFADHRGRPPQVCEAIVVASSSSSSALFVFSSCRACASKHVVIELRRPAAARREGAQAPRDS